MNRAQPRILYLARNCPFGRSFGGQLRTLNVGRLLQRVGNVDLGLLLLEAPDADAMARTRAEFNVRAVWQMQRFPIANTTERLRHELDPSYLNTEGWCLTDADAAALHGLFPSYDVIWIHNLAVANGARVEHWHRTVLDVDDLRSRFHRSSLECAGSWGQRARALRQTLLWNRRERRLLKRFQVVVVCSEPDRQYLGSSERVVVIPNGFDASGPEPVRQAVQPPRIGFIGLLKYPPNSDGLRWFVQSVWPEVKRVHPTVRLRVAGMGADPGLAGLGRDIDVLGWVEDASSEIATWSGMIVPIRIGGGTRIKIAEGFGRRCPVVSTTLGAFGYDLKSGQELLLADTPDDFAQACLRLLHDPLFARQLADRAWDKYQRYWTWDAMGPAVQTAVEQCLRMSPAIPALQ